MNIPLDYSLIGFLVGFLLYVAYNALRRKQPNVSKLLALTGTERVTTRFPSIPANYLQRRPCLISEIIREYIRHFVSNNDLNNAADLLAQLVKIFAPGRVNEVISIQQRIAAIEEATLLNTLDPEIASRERNRLGFAILDLVDQI